MKRLQLNGLRLAIVVYASLHFFTSIIDHSLFLQIMSLSDIGILVFSLLGGSVRRFKLQGTILILAFTIMYFSGTSVPQGTFNGILQMREMVGLLAVIPLY